jgi:hypothetical protein
MRQAKSACRQGWAVMFDSLEEKIKHDDAAEISPRERVAKGVVISILSILLFGGLYYAIRLLE